MWWSKCCRTVRKSNEKWNGACGGASVAVLCEGLVRKGMLRVVEQVLPYCVQV